MSPRLGLKRMWVLATRNLLPVLAAWLISKSWVRGKKQALASTREEASTCEYEGRSKYLPGSCPVERFKLHNLCHVGPVENGRHVEVQRGRSDAPQLVSPPEDGTSILPIAASLEKLTAEAPRIHPRRKVVVKVLDLLQAIEICVPRLKLVVQELAAGPKRCDAGVKPGCGVALERLSQQVVAHYPQHRRGSGVLRRPSCGPRFPAP